MRIFGKLSLVILAIIALSACEKNSKWHCTHGNGLRATESRVTVPFDGIELRMGADVIIHDGDGAHVRIEASQNLMNLIETRISGSTLIIEEMDGECVWDDETIKIYASTSSLEKLRVLGSGDIWNIDPLQSNNLQISIEGHGDINLTELHAEAFSIHIDGSGDVALAGKDTSTLGNITIRGSGDVSTMHLPTEYMSVDISGSGDVDVHALKTLQVKINGSGDVGYYGNPQITTDISGSGNVIKR